MPFWQQRMGPIFQGCFKTVAQPDGKSFSFVATMGPNGKVTDVYVDHETNIYQCFVAALMAEQFPAAHKTYRARTKTLIPFVW